MKTLDQIITASQALRFVGAYTFEWFGKRPPDIAPAVRRKLGVEARIRHRDAALCQALYQHFYRHGYARPIRWEANVGHTGDGAFVQTLTRAHKSLGWIDNGWQVIKVIPPRAIIQKAGLRLTTFIDELETSADITDLGSEIVGLRRPSRLAGLSPGYYMVASDAPLEKGSGGMLRHYWNVAAKDAPELIRVLSESLNNEAIRFRLKTANAPAGYDRCDSAVLYTCTADYDRLYDLLGKVLCLPAVRLAAAVPVFCKALAPGLGLAEDPPDQQSFGLNRCSLLSQGFLKAPNHSNTKVRFERTVETFETAGISLSTPYLNPGSVDHYRPYNVTSPVKTLSQPNTPLDIHELHDAVARIAQTLCNQAIWYQERCTWLVDDHDNPAVTSTKTLGPDLYAGLAGVALFLAEHARVSGCDLSAKTARAALRQSLSRLVDVKVEHRASLYSGWTGVAVCAHRISKSLRDPEILQQAKRLAKQSSDLATNCDETDLMSGKAGAILGLLYLANNISDKNFTKVAIQIADQLLACAERNEFGMSWQTINKTREHRLTGMSHGGAGIAFALFHLGRTTGVKRFTDAACAALKFEQQWFDPAHGNWPDLREARLTSKFRRSAKAFSTFWCHGAPGIGLSRLAAFQITNDHAYLDQAIIAFMTTLKDVRRQSLHRIADATLCHGIVGNADVLLSASRDKKINLDTNIETTIQTVGMQVTKLVSGSNQTANPTRYSLDPTNPGLMTGLAGTGWFLLRLIDRDVPSILNGCLIDTA